MQIYETLKSDHDAVKQLLNELVALKEGDEYRGDLISQIRDELIPHARAEEAVFYNSLRSIEAARDLIMHSYQEHMEAEALLRTLQVKDKIDADWRSTAAKLREAVLHHTQEEEGKIFGAAQQLFSEEEAEMMGEAFEKLKEDVRDESFLTTTLEMVANLMPPRLSKVLGNFNLERRI